MTEQSNSRITLEVLAAGRLPERIVDSIEEMELTTEEVVEWEESKPRVRFWVSDGELKYAIRGGVPLKRLITLITLWLLAIRFGEPLRAVIDRFAPWLL